ncbi:putative mitochondrial protein [Cucumis melo var. makuwa]|uniref:Mitochondrial protein n=1 Tax=Cucumis melo var. makuwa TaxID=1194695 RepID=A0A5A7SKD8_CUCMM|nr:putative mitochondrial protein [Cucumis melo var. makuwa]
MTNSIESHINYRMSENDRSKTNSTFTHTNSPVGKNNKSETVVPEDMVEKGNVDEVITDKENRVDENEVVAESTENRTKQDHPGNISKYDPSLDLPIG